MNILDKIVAEKRLEIAERKQHTTIQKLEISPLFERSTLSMRKHILMKDKFGIIAEFKRQSPSKGIINTSAKVEEVTKGYIDAGASALSVLTDEKFFGGSSADLTTARKINNKPIIRKDFVIDEYQIVEAKSIGADAILLIAAILSPAEVERLASFAKSLGLESLLELHDKEELKHICPQVDLVGINNRNLKDFSVDINKSIEMSKNISDDFVKVAESGISEVETIIKFRENGFKGFLMGERFMHEEKPELACKNFITELEKALMVKS